MDTKKAVLFVRVSSKDDRQDYQRQIDDLQGYCAKNGLQVVKVIAEKISGAKKNEERSGIKELLALTEEKAFDVLVISEVSRLGRSPFEVQKMIEALSLQKISIHIQSLNLVTIDENGERSAMVDFMLAILMQFAKIERETLITRVRSGLERAKRQGKTLGRPKGSAEKNEKFLKKYKPVKNDILSGLSVRKVAKLHDVSVNTVLKVKNLLQKAA